MSNPRVDKIRAAFDGMAQGDPTLFTQLFAQDAVYTVLGSTRLSGRFEGMAEIFAKLIMPLTAQLATPIRLEAQTVFGTDDMVAVQACGRATLKSGAAYNNTYAFVFRFRGDDVVAVNEYLDTQLLVRSFAVPADREALLRSMDYNMWDLFREDVRLARGGELLETAAYWLGHNPRGVEFHNMVMVKGAIAADALIEAADGFYGPRHKRYSVCVRLHCDGELERDLMARGFSLYTSMPGMVLFDALPPTPLPAGLEIRAVDDEQGRRDFLHVNAEAYAIYGTPREYAEDAFCQLDSVCAPHLQAFLAYKDGVPVAGASLYLTHGVAGIGWVGTLPEQRGHGYAEAVTAAVVREGFQRGAAYANLQASPMGRPVYERMGFVTQTEYRVLLRS